MKFSPKRKAEIIKKTLQNAVNLADINYQIEPENLMVAECFVNKGQYLKRLRIMGRGTSSAFVLSTSAIANLSAVTRPLGYHASPACARDCRSP